MIALLGAVFLQCGEIAADEHLSAVAKVKDMPGLVALWTFQEEPGQTRKAVGKGEFPLKEMAGEVKRVEGRVFGDYSARLKYKQWFELSREDLGALDIHGPEATVSVVA